MRLVSIQGGKMYLYLLIFMAQNNGRGQDGRIGRLTCIVCLSIVSLSSRGLIKSKPTSRLKHTMEGTQPIAVVVA
jgi:hypothetical protein